jgi:hypothetical protein
MTQSMIGFLVGLAALLIVGFMVVWRYRRDHPAEGITEWLDAHHMGWMHHKH